MLYAVRGKKLSCYFCRPDLETHLGPNNARRYRSRDTFPLNNLSLLTSFETRQDMHIYVEKFFVIFNILPHEDLTMPQHLQP